MLSYDSLPPFIVQSNEKQSLKLLYVSLNTKRHIELREVEKAGSVGGESKSALQQRHEVERG